MFWIVSIVSTFLVLVGGYYILSFFGVTGAVVALAVLLAVLLAIWIDRTA
jgi:hypothetical protein